MLRSQRACAPVLHSPLWVQASSRNKKRLTSPTIGRVSKPTTLVRRICKKKNDAKRLEAPQRLRKVSQSPHSPPNSSPAPPHSSSPPLSHPLWLLSVHDSSFLLAFASRRTLALLPGRPLIFLAFSLTCLFVPYCGSQMYCSCVLPANAEARPGPKSDPEVRITRLDTNMPWAKQSQTSQRLGPAK